MSQQSAKSAILRERAEDFLSKTRGDVQSMKMQDVQELIYELQVHKIELKMQNEALREAQEKLETSRQKYRDLYDNAPVGHLTLDRQGVILEANLTAARMLGCTDTELTGNKFSRLISPSSQDAYYMHFRSIFHAVAPRCAEVVLNNKALRVQLNSQAVAGQRTCRISMSDVSSCRPIATVA